MLIPITIGIVVVCASMGVLYSLASPPPSHESGVAQYQRLIQAHNEPLRNRQFRENYYTTSRIEKEQIHQAVILDLARQDIALDQKRVELGAMYNQLEAKVLELKHVKFDIYVGRKLQNLEFRENKLSLAQMGLDLSHRENVLKLEQKHFAIKKDVASFDLERKHFQLQKTTLRNEMAAKQLKISHAIHKQQMNNAISSFRNQQYLHKMNVAQQQIKNSEVQLKLAERGMLQQFVSQKIGLDFERKNNALMSQKLQLRNRENWQAHTQHALKIDKLNFQTSKMNFEEELRRQKHTLQMKTESLNQKSSFLTQQNHLENLRNRLSK